MWKLFKKVLPQAGKSGKRLEHDLTRKAHKGRHQCVNCRPSEENRRNNETWTFDTRKALEDHSRSEHKDLLRDKNNILCSKCGNIIGKEVTDCGYLAPHTPSCARISNMPQAEIDSILIQQYHERKGIHTLSYAESESEEEEEKQEESESESESEEEEEEEEEEESESESESESEEEEEEEEESESESESEEEEEEEEEESESEEEEDDEEEVKEKEREVEVEEEEDDDEEK